MTQKPLATSQYVAWKLAVDRALKREYAITIDDAGLSEDDLILHWKQQDSPHEYVDWLGKKYDLTPISRGLFGIAYPLKTNSR